MIVSLSRGCGGGCDSAIVVIVELFWRCVDGGDDSDGISRGCGYHYLIVFSLIVLVVAESESIWLWR